MYIDGEPSTGGGSGATGAIYTFVVNHQGQNVSLTDNNGATYSGRFGKISSTSGAQNTDIGQVGADEEANDGSKYTYYESPLPEDGDTIVANFEVAGTSRAGMSVKIVGTFQGTVATGVFTGRTLRGTWIESGGKTGDVYGQTTFIPVATSDTDTGTGTETATEETAAE